MLLDGSRTLNAPINRNQQQGAVRLIFSIRFSASFGRGWSNVAIPRAHSVLLLSTPEQVP